MDILRDTKIDFIGKRYYAFVFSAILSLLGIIATILIPMGKANLGIDFTGGVAVQFKFEKSFAIEDARKLLENEGFKDAEIQQFAEGNRLLIRLKKAEGELKAASDKLTEIFTTGFAGNTFAIESTTAVGPTVGKKLQKDALWAVAISLLGILLYVAWRFEFRFGVAAVAATFHDVLAILGVLFVLNKEINLLIITALLTLAGYSLTDTVVVFDRIRENLRKHTKEGFSSLINRSVNEVLTRTMITSGTTLLSLDALLILGGAVIRDFSLALFLGIIVGTFSS